MSVMQLKAIFQATFHMFKSKFPRQFPHRVAERTSKVQEGWVSAFGTRKSPSASTWSPQPSPSKSIRREHSCTKRRKQSPIKPRFEPMLVLSESGTAVGCALLSLPRIAAGLDKLRRDPANTNTTDTWNIRTASPLSGNGIAYRTVETSSRGPDQRTVKKRAEK